MALVASDHRITQPHQNSHGQAAWHGIESASPKGVLSCLEARLDRKRAGILRSQFQFGLPYKAARWALSKPARPFLVGCLDARESITVAFRRSERMNRVRFSSMNTAANVVTMRAFANPLPETNTPRFLPKRLVARNVG